MPDLLAAAAAVTGLPLIAYPNGGDDVGSGRPALDRRPRPAAASTPAAVAAWTDRGAQWLGGCCRTGPADIAALARALRGPPGLGSGADSAGAREAQVDLDDVPGSGQRDVTTLARV